MTRSAMTGENKVSMLRPLSVLPRQNRLRNVIQHPAEKKPTNKEPNVDERNPSVPFHRVFSPQLPPVPQLPQSWEKIVVVFIQTDIIKFPRGASEQSLVAIWACHLSFCMIMLIMTNYMQIIWKTVKRCCVTLKFMYLSSTIWQTGAVLVCLENSSVDISEMVGEWTDLP